MENNWRLVLEQYNWNKVEGSKVYTTTVYMEGYEHLNLTAVIIGELYAPNCIEIVCNLHTPNVWLVCYADIDSFINYGLLAPCIESDALYHGRSIKQR